MSTLKVNTIQNTSAAHSSTPEEIAQGRAKAWVNLNGTGTVAIRDSFNVGSITDVGTGQYQANFTNNMSDANYAVSCAAMNGVNIGTGTAQFNVTWFTTTSSTKVGTWAQTSGSFADRDHVMIIIFGD